MLLLLNLDDLYLHISKFFYRFKFIYIFLEFDPNPISRQAANTRRHVSIHKHNPMRLAPNKKFWSRQKILCIFGQQAVVEMKKVSNLILYLFS